MSVSLTSVSYGKLLYAAKILRYFRIATVKKSTTSKTFAKTNRLLRNLAIRKYLRIFAREGSVQKFAVTYTGDSKYAPSCCRTAKLALFDVYRRLQKSADLFSEN